MTAKTKTSAGQGARHDRTVQEYQHDTYKLRGKLTEPTICTECGAKVKESDAKCWNCGKELKTK